jgi:hypothetical protein
MEGLTKGEEDGARSGVIEARDDTERWFLESRKNGGSENN